jgi:ABC-type phosphate/phosphonate transport system permease subunit
VLALAVYTTGTLAKLFSEAVEAIRGFQYAQTCAVPIVLVVGVTLIDVASARLRRRFI